MIRRTVRTVAVAGTLALSACAYHLPHAAVRIGMNAFPSDVAYGAPVTAALPGVVPIRMSAQPPSPYQPGGGVQSGESGPVSSVLSPPPIATCPGPRSSSVSEPTISRVLGAPLPASYPYRATEQTNTGSTPGGVVKLAETRQVSRVVTSGNTMTFTVTTVYTGTGIVQNTDYRVVTSSAVPPDQESSVPVGTLSGVYVTDQSVTTTAADGSSSTSTLTWSPPLQVLKLPATPGSIWAVSSTDQKTGASESFTAKVTDVKQANACGSLVQGYEVDMSGQLITPGSSYPMTFDETEILAPQYGGLVLADNASLTMRSSPTDTKTQVVTDTINVTPKLAGGAA